MAEHYAGRKYVYDVIDLSAEESYSSSYDENLGVDGMMVMQKSLLFAHAKPEVPRYHEVNRLASELLYCLDSKVKGTLVPLPLVGSFFEFIPARLGRNAALDDAVSCLCAIYCGTSPTPYSLHSGVRQRYVKALSSLRGCLGDLSLRMESETLCASILLQMCEVSFALAQPKIFLR